MVAIASFSEAVDVRPLRRGERHAVAAVFAGLSESSRRNRFLAAKPELPAHELSYLADVGGNHVALVATVRGSGRPIGIARYVRDCSQCDTADVAFAVVDRWQGGGVGRTLACRLAFDFVMLVTRCALLKRIGAIESAALDGPALELTVLLGA